MGWMRYLELQLAWPSEVVRICRCHEWSERRAVDSGRPTLEVQVELKVHSNVIHLQELLQLEERFFEPTVYVSIGVNGYFIAQLKHIYVIFRSVFWPWAEAKELCRTHQTSQLVLEKSVVVRE